MLAIVSLLTVDEFWDTITQHPLEEGYYELNRGVLEMAGGAGTKHGAIAFRLTLRVGNYVEEHQLGLCTTAETCYVLSAEDKIIRCPDFAFTRADRVPQPIPDKFAPFAPDFAVEVKSPSDSLRQLRLKCEEYLAYGVGLVWLVLPDTQQVEVYQPGQDILIVTGDAPLLGYEVLPGLSLPAQSLFPR